MSLPSNVRRIVCGALGGSLLLAAAAPRERCARAAEPDSAQAAEALTDQAYAQHAAGKHAEAIGTYLRAYELSKAGAILFNIAAIYDRKLRERALAIEYYRRYVQAPDATPEFVQKALARLAVLKREADDEEQARSKLPPAPIAASTPPEYREPASAPPPAEPPAPVAPAPHTEDAAPIASRGSGWRGWRTTGVIVGGVGLAGIGASLALGLVAKGKNDDANALCGPSSCASERGVSLDRQAADFATAATVTFVVGAALVASGVTLYLVAPRSPASSAHMALSPLVGASGAGFAIHGSL
jgi:tetratricopeptide (TPR) repeat protein